MSNSKRHLITHCVLAVVGMTASSVLYAQETRWYVSADVGQSQHRTTSVDAGIVGGSFGQKDTQTGIAIGGQINKQFAVELGYADFGKAKISGSGALPCPPATACALVVFPLAGDVRAKATHLSLIASAPLADGLAIYGRLGAAQTDRSTQVRVGSVSVSSGDKKTEVIYGVGLGYAISKNIEATLEWKKLGDSEVDSVGLGVRLRF